jgi:subtilisin family serine protease
MSAPKLTLSCIAACALLAACGGGGDNPATPAAGPTREGTQAVASSRDIVPDEVVVKLLAAADLQALLAEYGLTLLDQFGQRPIYRLGAVPGTDIEALAGRLAADPRVRYAEPNLLGETPEGRRQQAWAIGGDAGTYATQWNTLALRLPEAHAISRGTGVTVAVLDTGVDASHEALADRMVAGFDFVDFDAVANEEGAAGDAGYGHGTHVASLVAQVAPDARIMPIRVLDPQGVGNIWVLGEGLLHAVDPDGVATTDDGAKVINLSLGTLRRTALLEDIIEIVSCGGDYDVGDDEDDEDDEDTTDTDPDLQRCAASGGAVVVSAAGNSGDETLHFPAAERHAGALAVAASTEVGTLATFSTRGNWVLVASPGDQIYGAIPGGRWAVWSGTSMAAPMVAGAAALLRTAQPQWKPADVTNRLASSGVGLCDYSVKEIDPAAALGGASPPSRICP